MVTFVCVCSRCCCLPAATTAEEVTKAGWTVARVMLVGCMAIVVVLPIGIGIAAVSTLFGLLNDNYNCGAFYACRVLFFV